MDTEEEFWEGVYHNFFPAFHFCGEAIGASCDKWGKPEINRLVYLSDDKLYRMMEILLPPIYPKLYLEIGYDMQHNFHGWIERLDVRADYVAFGWHVQQKAAIFSVPHLQRAYVNNRREWIAKGNRRKSVENGVTRVYLELSLPGVQRAVASASSIVVPKKEEVMFRCGVCGRPASESEETPVGKFEPCKTTFCRYYAEPGKKVETTREEKEGSDELS